MTTVLERRAQDQRAVLFISDFSPPRGPSAQLLEPAKTLDADFISVAYNPGRSTRVNSALAAHWIKENAGKDVVFTLATRDMNRLAAQSLLLGAALLGLENLVVLKGDGFSERELTAVKPVDDFTPTQLLSAVSGLNEGLDYKGGKLRSPTVYCVGASIDLGHEIERETGLTRRKVEAGAQFFLLQGLFDPQPIKEFYDGYARRFGEELSVPVFCGVQVVAPGSMVFGGVPGWVSDDLEKGRPGEEIAVQVVQGFIDRGFRSFYLIPPILKAGRRDYEAAQRVMEAFRG